MVSVEWKINGRSVSSSSFKSAIEQAIFSKVSENIAKKIGSYKCKTHNQHAKVVVVGKSLDSLKFNVSGCCEEFITEVKSKLK